MPRTVRIRTYGITGIGVYVIILYGHTRVVYVYKYIILTRLRAICPSGGGGGSSGDRVT